MVVGGKVVVNVGWVLVRVQEDIVAVNDCLYWTDMLQSL